MNLYLKYRPKTIDELDLSGVRKTLTDMVKANKVAHAYLLTGPRGAGKTSTARVLARMVNCEKNVEKLGEPCNECAACQSILNGSAVDVIEIDAASNRGIDDIRELKEKIRLSPAILPRKVYIIDEVHMLTTEAFNALLKTLEEPPAHSLFILCTTELHKVPDTIVSRCVGIYFTKATSEEMQRSFKRVIEGEGKEVTDEAIEYLARSVDGSFRDGVKILDQVLSNSDKVELSDIELVVSGSASYKVGAMVNSLVAKDVTLALEKLSEAVKSGVDLSYLIVSIMRGLRDLLLSGGAPVEVAKLIFSLDEVARRLSTSLDGELLIQVVIVEWCAGSDNQNTQKIRQPEKSESRSTNVSVIQKTDSAEKPTNRQTESPIPQTNDSKDAWKLVVASLGQNNLALDTILSKARPGNIAGDEMTIYVQYDFHRQQLMSEKNLVNLEGIISRAVGRTMRIKCEIAEPVKAAATMPEAPSAQGDTIDEAMAIFS